MKYIKTYETKITQKALIETMTTFLKKALPDNFIVKLYQGTINIKDVSLGKSCDDKLLDKRRRNVGYFYVTGDTRSGFEMHLSCRTLEGSNINIAVKYIIGNLKDNMSVGKLFKFRYQEDFGWMYDQQYIVNFDSDYFKDVINMFNNLPPEDLNIFMIANKYNL